MPTDHEHEAQPLLHPEEYPPVYDIIHQIRQDVITYIDTPLSYADLAGAELTYSFVKPLEEKYSKMNNKATVFCFLLNRVHFTQDQNFSSASLSKSRALLCEILATRMIRQWSNLIELANVLITSWPVFEGCSHEVLDKGRELQDDFDPKEKVGNAIEMAIISHAKIFVKSAPCQKVIDAIWSGKIVYTAESTRSLIRDTYKLSPIHYYDPTHAHLLNHYRLKVPAIRSVLEYINFLILFVLFVINLEFYDPEAVNWAERIFMVYASGFCLEKLAAMHEHGLRVYIHGTWNGFDVAFIFIFIPYILLRLFGVAEDQRWARLAGMDCLALAACLLFPRLAFVTLSNNLLVLAFRAMFSEFAFVDSIPRKRWITWWLLDLYFGLDATGFSRASNFHPIFGPILMVTFACLSNTLLLTVLVSILSHTFSTISADAEAEARFRRTVATIEGVKADALFSYLPPMNLLAFAIMFPASYILSPRWFHKVNVFMIRVCAAPVLAAITVYERQTIHLPGTTIYDKIYSMAEKAFDSLPRRLRRMTFFEGLAGNTSDIHALFQIEEELNQSALDTHDDAPILQQGSQPRQLAADGERTRSAAGTAGLGTSLRRVRTASEASTDRGTRRRSGIFSVEGMTPAVVQSPLAQIYQPIVPLEDEVGGQSPVTAASSSFVPRRRVTSITGLRRPSIEPTQPLAAPSAPHNHPARPGGPPPAEHMVMPIPPSTLPEQVEEDLVISPPPEEPDSLTRRLIAMEERQQRIENLLLTLSAELRSTRKGM
ncbi:hypothetical protein FRC17_010493 [Serendipita sp. 399]|nr:hypothetical protein FRC17_010493 [Serendipita sp. 399]